MISSNYSYLIIIIIYLHTVIYYQGSLSKGHNNGHPVRIKFTCCSFYSGRSKGI